MKKSASVFCAAIFAAILTVLSACNPIESISVTEAPMPTLRSMSELVGELVVRNDNGTAVTVDNASLTAYYRGRELITANLAEPVAVPARKTSRVTYRFDLENVTIMTLAALPGAISDPSQVTVDITARVRYGAARKKIAVKNMPLNKIITNFGG